VREKVLAYIREHELLKPGDRVGVAVSGGADSVGLLRVLLDLRAELGVILSALHFNHKIRGAEADQDETFVRDLANQHALECHCSSMDVPAYAAARKLSLEAAGHEARYQFFESFLDQQTFDSIATGHTMDDQAETVLMRILRGAGTKGLAGIYPRKSVLGGTGHIARPLLGIRRAEIREYLGGLQQAWREDATNVDLQYTRNRIRHGLMPLIETRFQPSVVPVLAQLADVAREEENYWDHEIAGLMPALCATSTEAGAVLNVPKFLALFPALQRRVIRRCAQKLGIALDFEHLNRLLQLTRTCNSGKQCELPVGWVAIQERRELRFERRCEVQQGPLDYEYRLSVPGEVEVLEIGRLVRAFLRPVKCRTSGYNPEQSLDPVTLGPQVIVRNWRPGDRLSPAHSKGPKKLKELFEEHRVPQTERRSWPVVLSGGKLAWARGFGASTEFQPTGESKQVVVIEEHVPHPRREH
jgi:tRNA(Ile)-lysidine synthase